ncbi:MAG: hypothetical protein K6F33_08645 [Bacteroidales bacterium]|nr:hypothetical protein [Bacteroidales bacterium]
MKRLYNIIRISIFAVALLLPDSLTAQIVKEIAVSRDTSYSERLTMKKGRHDMDVTVKFVFSEDDNMLSATVSSECGLMVFWDQVETDKIIGWRGRIKTKLLQYVASVAPRSKFRFTKQYRRTVMPPKNQELFSTWITERGIYPEEQSCKMTGNEISQNYKLTSKTNRAFLTLNDIFIVENKKENKYSVIFGKDLDIQYQIALHRDPCYGKDSDLENARTMHQAAVDAYQSIKKLFGSGKVTSEDRLKLFNDMHGMLMSQYPPRDNKSECEDIQKEWDSYNLYADSIAKISCVLELPAPIPATEDAVEMKGLMPKDLLMKARQIDQMVSRWINSNDAMERRDIAQMCQMLIKDGNFVISTQGAYTAEQWQAVGVFRKAESYFQSICQ